MKFFSGTVYSKALAIFLAASLLLLGAVAALTQLIILRELSMSERREMRTMLQRLSLILNRDGQSLQAFSQDWSRSPQKLTPENLEEVSAHFLAILDSDGRPQKIVQARSSGQTSYPDDRRLAAILSENGFNLKTTKLPFLGYFLINDDLYQVTINPIVSQRNTTTETYLVVGMLFQAGSWNFLEGLFQANIKFHSLRNARIDEDTSPTFLTLLQTQEIVIDDAADKQIRGYRLIRSAANQPLGYISIVQARLLRQEGLRAIQIFLTGISIAGGSLVLVIWILLDRTILARILDLTRQLESEKQSNRLPVKLKFKGSDELGTLARSIENLAVRLENTQSHYRHVVEDQTEIICRFRPDMILSFHNEVFGKTFPLHEDKANSVHLGDFLPTKAAMDIEFRFHDLSLVKPITTFTHEVEATRGLIWLRSTLRKNFSEAGICEGGQWVAAEITAQVEAQKQMLESERRFRRLFEAASDGILVIDDSQGTITDINPSLCRMLMLAGSELLGRPLQEIPAFRPCLDIISYYRKNEAFGARFAPFRHDSRLERAEGSAIFVELACSSYESTDRGYIQVNFRNITDRISGERKLRRLSAQLLRLQDEERRRIARELHDSTAQNLSALEMNMSLLEPLLSTDARATRLVTDTRQIAGECSRELRNISYLLHPPLIDEVGLSFAINWFADGFSKRTGIDSTVEISERFPRLGADLEMPLFRVVQEAMTNIYRHSGASRAWVKLYLEGRLLILEISDNGKGFAEGVLVEEADELAGRKMGVGLAGMRERLANAGGKLVIESSASGATVRIRIPLSADHDLDT